MIPKHLVDPELMRRFTHNAHTRAICLVQKYGKTHETYLHAKNSYISGASFGYQLAVEEQRKILEEIKQDLIDTLCDPDGYVCIDGSQEDRAILDRAIEKLKAHLEVQNANN